jgi:predicted kinase
LSAQPLSTQPSDGSQPGQQPTLVVFGGLPGVGKTTLAKALARSVPALLLRIDAIETAVRTTGAVGAAEMGAVGYVVAAAVARDELLVGRTVVIDAVNPVESARVMWRELADATRASLRIVEVVCSGESEHRRRVETRITDLAGGYLPSWQEVLDREYEPWTEPRLTIDTAHTSVSDGVAAAIRWVRGHAGEGLA